jgi:fumarate reductase subunit C
MSEIRPIGRPGYSPYHPKWYRTRMSTYWWLWRGAYLKFILREISSAFIMYFVAITLWQLWALGQGPDAYARWQAWMTTPFAMVLNGITLFFIVFHAVTWFNLAPKAMVVRLGDRSVPGAMIAASNYAAWAVVSLFVLWILSRR